MSVRRTASTTQPHVAQLQKELGDLKQAALAANASDSLAAEGAETTPNAPSFDQLSGVEQSAASLGVHPDSWKPIGFMNNAHFEQLKKSNALSDDLARRIDAYKQVSMASA